jgi:hypothetical protein
MNRLQQTAGCTHRKKSGRGKVVLMYISGNLAMIAGRGSVE